MNHRLKLTALLAAGLILLSGGGAAGYMLKGSGSTSQPESRFPVGWNIFINPGAGYSIAYPPGWDSARVSPGATLFDEDLITLDPNAGWPPVDLEVIANPETFARVLRTKTAEGSFRTVRKEDTTIAGVPAVRLETVVTGGGLFANGTRIYGYILDRDGTAFTIETIVAPDAAGYDELTGIVDTAAESLRFDA